MKKHILAVIIIHQLVTLGVAAEGGSAPVTTLNIGLSPFYSVSDNKRVRDSLINFVLGPTPAGTRISIQDAYALQSVAELTLPNLGAKYDSPTSRARVLQAPLASLVGWFNQQLNTPARAELKNTAAVRVPEWMDQLSAQSSPPRVALVIGSPLRIDPREPSFDMSPDLCPSDGHLVAPADQSIFTTIGKQTSLRGSVVLWSYLSEGLFANELHSQRVRRFWALWVNGESGALAGFSPDLSGVLALATQRGLAPIGQYQIDTNDSKITMRTCLPRAIPRWMPESVNALPATPPQPTPAPPSPQANPVMIPPVGPTPVPASAPLSRAVPAIITTPLEIGIAWESGDKTVDLDLYVRATSRAAELFFQRVRTPEGEYVFDWRSPNAGMDYEWVRLSPPIRPDQVSVWINLYEGRGPVTGAMLIHYNERTYRREFRITANRGNRGFQLPTRAMNPCWTQVDISQVIASGEIQ